MDCDCALSEQGFRRAYVEAADEGIIDQDHKVVDQGRKINASRMIYLV